jgi:hypothetical protein
LRSNGRTYKISVELGRLATRQRQVIPGKVGIPFTKIVNPKAAIPSRSEQVPGGTGPRNPLFPVCSKVAVNLAGWDDLIQLKSICQLGRTRYRVRRFPPLSVAKNRSSGSMDAGGCGASSFQCDRRETLWRRMTIWFDRPMLSKGGVPAL